MTYKYSDIIKLNQLSAKLKNKVLLIININ